MSKFNLFERGIPYRSRVCEEFTFTKDTFTDVADLLKAVLVLKEKMRIYASYIHISGNKLQIGPEVKEWINKISSNKENMWMYFGNGGYRQVFGRMVKSERISIGFLEFNYEYDKTFTVSVLVDTKESEINVRFSEIREFKKS